MSEGFEVSTYCKKCSKPLEPVAVCICDLFQELAAVRRDYDQKQSELMDACEKLAAAREEVERLTSRLAECEALLKKAEFSNTGNHKAVHAYFMKREQHGTP